MLQSLAPFCFIGTTGLEKLSSIVPCEQLHCYIILFLALDGLSANSCNKKSLHGFIPLQAILVHIHLKFRTALHWAARRGYEEICLLLLASGFSREVKDHKGRTPFDVCAEDNKELREILRPESEEYKDIDDIMPSAVDKRRHSENTVGHDKFVPNYIRNPPFPYVTKASSFDCGTNTICNCTDRKQAFRRVTLPGGSTVEQLKKMVEKSMRNGKIEAILTLPDRVLVEDDAQIAQFSDCQRVEVIYAEGEVTPPLVSFMHVVYSYIGASWDIS
ncbi:unnamed protein product [Strongylus vulgaris]|uniref:Uncharacterized protein n=1 Tax=Strongylus vulgaris TaxID=40348 RepID=A0A3P7J884_STRVU|nr:unnamed protein product [Strongylus vulgaris]